MPSIDATLHDVLDAMDEPALVVDSQVVRIANRSAKALLGTTIEGSNVRVAIRQPAALGFVLAGEAGDLEVRGIGQLGQPWRLSLRKISDTSMLIRLSDRSESHAAEKLRVDFVANASHELRTPLTTVIGYSESLEDEGLDPELVASFGSTIRGEARRMLRIIEDLLSLSRIESDRFLAPTANIRVTDVVRSAVDNVQPLAEKRSCTIHSEVGEQIADIRGDFPQLLQLAENLLSNAIRYGCPGGEDSVEISAFEQNGWVILKVTDHGHGIPREHLPFITRRFYRVDEARSRNSGGTGLGLAIVKHIVERHRGMLSVDSEVGKGTTVTVRLPIDG